MVFDVLLISDPLAVIQSFQGLLYQPHSKCVKFEFPLTSIDPIFPKYCDTLTLYNLSKNRKKSILQPAAVAQLDGRLTGDQ